MPEPGTIVINTGPLLALIAGCGDLQVLRALYRDVMVPQEVSRELQAGGTSRFGVQEFQQATWLKKQATPVTLSPFLSQALDLGEASVIQLALDNNIQTVAID